MVSDQLESWSGIPISRYIRGIHHSSVFNYRISQKWGGGVGETTSENLVNSGSHIFFNEEVSHRENLGGIGSVKNMRNMRVQ